MRTLNIYDFERDGARILSLNQTEPKGQIATLECGCGLEFTKTRRQVLYKPTPLRCKQCFHDALSELALERLGKA